MRIYRFGIWTKPKGGVLFEVRAEDHETAQLILVDEIAGYIESLGERPNDEPGNTSTSVTNVEYQEKLDYS